MTDKDLAALGSVVAESAHLESTLDLIILLITRMGESEYEVFMRGKMIGAKLEIVKELGVLKLRSKKRQRAWMQLIDGLKSLNSDRVIAVHGLWGPAGGYTRGNLMAASKGWWPATARVEVSNCD